MSTASDEEIGYYETRWAEFGLVAELEWAWIGAVETPATPLPDPVAGSTTYTPSIAEGEEAFATTAHAGFYRAAPIGADEDFRRVMDSYRSMDNDVPNPIAAPAGQNTGSYDDMRLAVNGALADADDDVDDACMVPAEPFGLASGAQVMKGAISYNSTADLHLEGAHIVEAIEQEMDGTPGTEGQVVEPTTASKTVTFDRMHVVQNPDAADGLKPDPVVMTTEEGSFLTSRVVRVRQVESLPGYPVEALLHPVLGLGTWKDDFATVEELSGMLVDMNPHRSMLNRIENAKYGNHLRKTELSRINRVSSSLNRFVRSASAALRRARAPFSAAALGRLEDLRMFDEMTRLAAFDPRYTPALYEMSPESAVMVLALLRSTTSSRTAYLSDPAGGR